MKKALVLGKGKSGESAKLFLEKIGYFVTIVNTDELKHMEDSFFKDLSFVCISPGIDINDLSLSRIKTLGIEICSEIELGYKFLPCDIVAVTGTNGKTTTTTLIGEMCKKYKKTYVGGNIGVPLTSFCGDVVKDDICVLEVSSFQAETMTIFKPYISVFLNFTEDHLNRHKTMTKYFEAKASLFKNQTDKDFAVINYDDSSLYRFSQTLKSNVYYFSMKRMVKGIYMKRDIIYFNDGKVKYKLFSMPENIVGNHNKQNALAAILVAKLLGVDESKIKEVLMDFKLSENRLEFVCDIDGVKIINDSKSTNIASSLAACVSFKEKLTLILGGSDKGYDFDELFLKIPKNVKRVVVVGETKVKIVEAAARNKFTHVYVEDDFQCAVRKACMLSKRGEVVLLSPACASFDMFISYAERGRKFKEIVMEIKNENLKNAGEKRT